MNYPLTLDMDFITYNIGDLVSRDILLGILNIPCQGRGDSLGDSTHPQLPQGLQNVGKYMGA